MYDNGAKFSGPLFSAFCLRNNEQGSVKVGFTCPRGLGGAVVRNRIKRRVREAVRARLERVGAGWEIVINPRIRAMTAPFPQLVTYDYLVRCNDFLVRDSSPENTSPRIRQAYGRPAIDLPCKPCAK